MLNNESATPSRISRILLCIEKKKTHKKIPYRYNTLSNTLIMYLETIFQPFHYQENIRDNNFFQTVLQIHTHTHTQHGSIDRLFLIKRIIIPRKIEVVCINHLPSHISGKISLLVPTISSTSFLIKRKRNRIYVSIASKSTFA